MVEPVALVTLLSWANSALLERLRKDHPEAAQMLGGDRTRDISATPHSPVSPQAGVAAEDPVAAKLDLLNAGISPLQTELDAVIGVVVRKMKFIKLTKTLGAVVATLSGLVLATTSVMGMEASWDKVISAGFATIGGIVVIVADFFEQAPSGVRIASAEEFGKLSQIKVEMGTLIRRTARHGIYPLRSEEIDDMIASLDKYAEHINRLKVAQNAR